MGLLDKFVSDGEEFGAAEGVTGVVLSAVAADGTITEEEVQSLSASISRMNLFQDMTRSQVQDCFTTVHTIAQDESVHALLDRSAKAIPDELRETTFAIATDLLFTDGHIEPAERDFLDEVARQLEVDKVTAEKIVDVIAIKNRG